MGDLVRDAFGLFQDDSIRSFNTNYLPLLKPESEPPVEPADLDSYANYPSTYQLGNKPLYSYPMGGNQSLTPDYQASPSRDNATNMTCVRPLHANFDTQTWTNSPLNNNRPSAGDKNNAASRFQLLCGLSNCTASFRDIIELIQHRELVHKRKHHCTDPGCFQSFTEARSLKRHIQTRHRDTRTEFCPHTGCLYDRKGFNRHDSFVKHIRKRHD